MKDRLVELSSPLALPIHPHLVYPKQSALAGQPLRAVGVVRGRPVWPVLGGAPEDDSNGGAGAGEGGDDKDGSSGSEGGDSGEGQGEAKGNPDAKIKALEEEKDRHYNKRQEAEQALSELQQKLKEIEDKDKSEAEKVAESLAEITKERDALATSNQQLMLEVAFLGDNTYTWQNPKRALQLADLSSVEFKDGKAVGLDKALEALAKSDPYLLKTEEKDETPGGPTGKQHNGQKKGSKGPDMAELKKKYPALRGR